MKTPSATTDHVVEENLLSPEHGPAQPADTALFFKKWLEKGRTISSAIPSSQALARTLLEPIDFSKPATIVELGAGTGPITRAISDRLRPHHRFVAIENDPDFCRVLRRRFPDLTILEGDATQLTQPLAKLGIERVDYVLSGIPTSALPPRSVVSLWRWLRQSLAPGGMFIQLTIAPLLYRALYERLFETVRYRMVWFNVPPGGIWYCANPRPS